ncbi:hypothetical protein Tco_0827265 [Tanacetum coccineum]
MTSESSTPTTTHITTVSNVNFECGKGVVSFNNDIALLEHTNPLYHLMLSFLKNSCVSTALTKQPSTYYLEYLREFWYSAEVDTSSNTITFTLSCSLKPLSFELSEFSTITGLKYYENYEALPPKATVKVALATLGPADEKNLQFTPSEVINKSPLRIRYLSLIWMVIAYILIWGLNVGIENILFSGLVAKLVKGKKGREVYICYTRRAMPKKQVDETQHAEEPVATDITKSLDASKSVEEERVVKIRATRPNRDSVSARSCPISLVHLESAPGSDTLRVPELHSAFGVTESQNKKNPKVLTFEGTESSPSVFLGQRTGDPSLHYKFTFSTNHLMEELENIKVAKNVVKGQVVTDAGIISLGTVDLDQVIEEAESDLESMPDDDIMSISRDDDEELDDFDKEFSVADEVVVDTVIDEILIEINTEDTTTLVSVAPSTEVPSVSDSKPTIVFPMEDVQALAAKSLYAPGSGPFDHLLRRMDFLAAHVHNMGKSHPKKFADKMDSVVPMMVVDAFEERLPEFLTNTLKNQLPQIPTDSVRETLPRFLVLEQSIRKSIFKNLWVKMGEVAGLLRQTAKHQMQMISYLEQVLHSTVKVPNDILVVNAINFTSQVNRTSTNMNELVGSVSRVVQLMKTSSPHVSAIAEGENEA